MRRRRQRHEAMKVKMPPDRRTVQKSERGGYRSLTWINYRLCRLGYWYANPRAIGMSLLDLDAFRRTSITREPFDFLIVPGFLKPRHAASVGCDFPDIGHTGLLPVGEVTYGSAFAALIDEIRSAELSRAFSEKFGLDLRPEQLMITVRGRCDAKDGRIHTDSVAKRVTALLYLNESWEAAGGRLRLLGRADDLEDVVAEVPPMAGTLVAFRRTDRSFHGHKPYVGVRRYVMFNWMADGAAARRETLRHRFSARVKRLLLPLPGRRSAAGSAEASHD